MHNSASLRAAVEFLDAFLGEAHDAGHFCMESPVFSQIGVFPRAELCPLLSHDDASGIHALACKEFHATALRPAIPDV